MQRSEVLIKQRNRRSEKFENRRVQDARCGRNPRPTASKIGEFRGDFGSGKPVRSTESSEFMERAMGIELYSQILSLNNARRCRRSKSQLVPSGAKLKVQQTVAAHMPRTGEVGYGWNGILLAHFVSGLG